MIFELEQNIIMIQSAADRASLILWKISPLFNLKVFVNLTISSQVKLKVIILAIVLFIVDVVGCGEDKVWRN
jgi:hypothetical protein